MIQIINTPLVSAIIATHNRSKYLPIAVESLLSQTYQNLEIVIVDDASTDDTSAVIEMLRQTDPRVIAVRSEVNIGPAAARNLGITKSSGEYIAIMDDDDVSLPQRFEKQISYLEINPNIMVLGSNIIKIDDDGNKIGEVQYPLTPDQIRWQLTFRDVIANPTVMMRKILFDQFGFSYNESIRGAEDYDLWVKISSKYKIANMDEFLLFYRLHSSNITRTDSKIVDYATKVIIVSQVKTYTNMDLPMELVGDLINPTDVKDLRIAILLSRIIIGLQKNAFRWGLTKRDRYVIKQSTVWRLRALLKTHSHNFSTLPYRIYCLILDPKHILKNVEIKGLSL